jgi:transposase
MLATAPHRAERNMRKRKVVKTHQNLYTFYRGDYSLLRNPQLLEVHRKVLGFFRGDPEKIKEDFKNPPPIQHNIIDGLLELE